MTLNAAWFAMFPKRAAIDAWRAQNGAERPRDICVGYADLGIVKECVMLGWALVFFILALAAAAFGFGGLAGTAAAIAQILFVIFLALTVLAFIVRAIQGRSVL